VFVQASESDWLQKRHKLNAKSVHFLSITILLCFIIQAIVQLLFGKFAIHHEELHNGRKICLSHPSEIWRLFDPWENSISYCRFRHLSRPSFLFFNRLADSKHYTGFQSRDFPTFSAVLYTSTKRGNIAPHSWTNGRLFWCLRCETLLSCFWCTGRVSLSVCPWLFCQVSVMLLRKVGSSLGEKCMLPH